MPEVMDEYTTLMSAVDGSSLARFGDGELRLAVGGKAVSQRADSRLQNELQQILQFNTHAIPCIPPETVSSPDAPRKHVWKRYKGYPYAKLFRGDRIYGSAFITRPDSAPWIDIPQYWEMVTDLWRDKHVLYMTGGDSHLPKIIPETAKSFKMYETPKRDAYDEIDTIVSVAREFYKSGDHIVLLACGAAATVAAHRLACNGIHAVDIGHMGMFYTVKGAYRMKPKDLCTDYYRSQLREAHAVKKWGTGGASWVPDALGFAERHKCKSVLDYGCGRGTFKKRMSQLAPEIEVKEYDPAIKGKEIIPKPADMVVSTDVLEHVEPECLDAVLDHIFHIGRKAAFLVIATKSSNKELPDGRNAHLIQEGMDFWKPKINALGYKHVWYEVRKHIIVRAVK